MDFKAKIGPLPAWAWGLLIGALFVVWMWVSSRNAPADVEVTESAPGDADYGGSVVEGSYGSDFSTVPIVTPGGSAAEVVSETNADWLRRAIAAVVDQGTVSTLSAQAALQKYLAGQTLSQGEQSIVNAATSKVGIPPEGVDTPSITPAPTTSDDYSTKVTVSAPATMQYGKSYPVKITAAWVNPAGKTRKPIGNMILEVDGKRVGASYGYNGEAVITIRPTKSGSYADGVIVLRGRIQPNTQTQKTKPSVSNPVTVRVK